MLFGLLSDSLNADTLRGSWAAVRLLTYPPTCRCSRASPSRSFDLFLHVARVVPAFALCCSQSASVSAAVECPLPCVLRGVLMNGLGSDKATNYGTPRFPRSSVTLRSFEQSHRHDHYDAADMHIRSQYLLLFRIYCITSTSSLLLLTTK